MRNLEQFRANFDAVLEQPWPFWFNLPDLGAIWGPFLGQPRAILGYSKQFGAIFGGLGIRTLTTQPGGLSILSVISGPSLGQFGAILGIQDHFAVLSYLGALTIQCSNFDNTDWWSLKSWGYLRTFLRSWDTQAHFEQSLGRLSIAVDWEESLAWFWKISIALSLATYLSK